MSRAAADGNFSRLVTLAQVNRGPLTLDLEAAPAECRLLARRFGLADVRRLRASVSMDRSSAQGDVLLRGRIEAEIEQTCVITLEPFPSAIDENFVLRLVTQAADTDDLEDADEVECDLDGEEVETLRGETIDVGETVAQYFALALDPHPRGPGASIGLETPTDADEDVARPFAALASLRSNQDRS